MTVRLISFTAPGRALAERLAAALGGEVNEGLSLHEWTTQAFNEADALIFIGAAGIAVRAIAPHVRHKSLDPAVVVVDEGGSFAVPILSGHLGGANDLAREIAELIGAVPVITTATDVRGVFAVDEWARHQNLYVSNPEHIKHVSGKILAGENVSVSSDYPISGAAPTGVVADGAADVRVSVKLTDDALCLVPRIAVLGVGCRRGTSAETIAAEYHRMLEEENISAAALCAVSSIDIKRNEPGLAAFCAAQNVPFVTYTAAELAAAEGEFTPSEFVSRTVGVDNVCERSAALASGGELIVRKRAANGVTLALALKPLELNWNWRD